MIPRTIEGEFLVQRHLLFVQDHATPSPLTTAVAFYARTVRFRQAGGEGIAQQSEGGQRANGQQPPIGVADVIVSVRELLSERCA